CRAHHNSRRSKILRRRDTHSSSASRGPPHNRRPEEKSSDTTHAPESPHSPTKGTFAPKAFDCRRTLSIRDKHVPDEGKRHAFPSCGKSDRDPHTRRFLNHPHVLQC